MTRIVFCLAAMLALAACVGDEVDNPPPPRAGESKAPPPPMASARPGPVSPVDPTDTCGATKLKYLVGRPKTEIPVPVDPKSRRVTCTTCPVTMDFRADRVNIFFDQPTGIIKEVKCG